MSVRVMSWVFQHSQSRGNDRLVLLAIADRADDDGGNCWKSTETLAGKAHVSKRTAQRCIDHLIAMGELESDDRRGKTSVLRVVMLAVTEGGDKLTPRQSVTGDKGDASGATTLTPDTSIHPLTPQPPASGGQIISIDHCDKHSKYRRSCARCDAAMRALKAKPPWCGGPCDETTRLIEDHDAATSRRCPECHPLKLAAREAS